MSHKALLLLFTSSMLLKADVVTEYFQGTAYVDTNASNDYVSPAFYHIPTLPSGVPIIGSFSFDPSLGREQIGLVRTPTGLTDVSYLVPATLTVQDASGSVTETGTMEYTVGNYLGSDDVGLALSASSDAIALDLPLGAAGDLSLAEFPWGVQPISNCVMPYSVDGVDACSNGSVSDEHFLIEE